MPCVKRLRAFLTKNKKNEVQLINDPQFPPQNVRYIIMSLHKDHP